jgi:CheY-like chemotaxis protein
VSDAPVRALVVDDDAFNIKLLGEIARAAGWQTDVAMDGVEALAAVERARPDVVLLDLMIPRLDGFGVLEHLRADPRTADVAVVVISAIQDPEARARAVELGADDFAAKPFRMLDVQTRARAALEMRAFRRRIEGRDNPGVEVQPVGRPQARPTLEGGARVDAAVTEVVARGQQAQVVTVELSAPPTSDTMACVDALLAGARTDAAGVFFRGDQRLSFVWPVDALTARRRVGALHAAFAAARGASGAASPRLWWGVGADRETADASSAAARSQDLEPIAT